MMGDRDYRQLIKSAIESIGRDIEPKIDPKDTKTIYIHEVVRCLRRSYSDRTLSIELKQYESFLLTLTTSLNEKIPSLEKISDRITAEKRESEQQKLLLREMIELFNNEIEDLEQALKEINE